jgi:homoserine O-succinyltransferase
LIQFWNSRCPWLRHRFSGSTPLQIDLTLVRITEHVSKHTSEEYLNTFYSTWESVRERKFDGFIITGAPVANIPFEEVRYWPEMLDIMDWTGSNVHQTMFICWGAQAALHHFHRAKRYRMEQKAFGVFRHKLVGGPNPWLRGFSDSPMIPVSRYNDIERASLSKDLEILIDNDEIGVCLLRDRSRRALYMLNHLEYDNRSLADEYERDVKAGLDTAPPVNLFPDGDTSAEPENRWRSHGHLLFQNWINEIYQTTPYEIEAIGK